jgi:hypothetical protein
MARTSRSVDRRLAGARRRRAGHRTRDCPRYDYAYLIWPAIGAPEFFVPWEAMALIGLGVPLLAAVVAVLFTRSKLPMVRRIE